ncbi:MAG: hypothetical protein AB7J35_21200 [Dehalococcoidia bacterium]
MAGFISARLLHAIPVLVIVSMLTFAGIELVPGDPVQALIGDPSNGTSTTPEALAKLREQYGLNDALPVRYFNYVSRVVHGDFGESITSRRPVTDVVGERVKVSLSMEPRLS